MRNNPLIQIKKLACEMFRRDDEGNVTDVHRVLDGVDLDIAQGEFVGILGHNGSGKSTLARHINALLTPSEGIVLIDGKDTAKEENELEVHKTAGMIFQNPDNQLVASVVEEDVGFGLENIGVPTEEIWNRVARALKAVGINDCRTRSTAHLSGGQKQRVAIAGVLAMKPRCIIMDEATAMLDPMGRKEVLATVRELNQKEKITILWITHYMEEVVEADRILVLNQGKIVMQGKPQEIFSHEKELLKYHLTLPETIRVRNLIAEKGITIPQNILTAEALADYLWQLKSRQGGRADSC